MIKFEVITTMSKYPGLNLSGTLSIYIHAPNIYKAPPSAQGQVRKSLR